MQLFHWEWPRALFLFVKRFSLCPFPLTRCISWAVLNLCIQSLLWTSHWILWLPVISLVLALKGVSWTLLFWNAGFQPSSDISPWMSHCALKFSWFKVKFIITSWKPALLANTLTLPTNFIITGQSTRSQTPKTVQPFLISIPFIQSTAKIIFPEYLLHHSFHILQSPGPFSPLTFSTSFLMQLWFHSASISHSCQSPNPLAALFFIIPIDITWTQPSSFISIGSLSCTEKTAQRADKVKIEPHVSASPEAPRQRMPSAMTFQSILLAHLSMTSKERGWKQVLWFLSFTYFELWILPNTPSLLTPKPCGSFVGIFCKLSFEA